MSLLLFNYKKDLPHDANLNECLGVSKNQIDDLLKQTLLLAIRMVKTDDGKKSTSIAEMSSFFGGKTCDEIAFIVFHLIDMFMNAKKVENEFQRRTEKAEG